MSVFNPDTFMDQGTSEAGSTSAPVCDAGEYPGVIDKVEPKSISSKKTGKDYVLVEITWKLENPEFEKNFGRKASVRQTLFPDFNASGALDMAKGKNVGLNRIREAVGLNKPGQAFNWKMLIGAGPAKVMVINKADDNSPDIMRAEVRQVGKLT